MGWRAVVGMDYVFSMEMELKKPNYNHDHNHYHRASVNDPSFHIQFNHIKLHLIR